MLLVPVLVQGFDDFLQKKEKSVNFAQLSVINTRNDNMADSSSTDH